MTTQARREVFAGHGRCARRVNSFYTALLREAGSDRSAVLDMWQVAAVRVVSLSGARALVRVQLLGAGGTCVPLVRSRHGWLVSESSREVSANGCVARSPTGPGIISASPPSRLSPPVRAEYERGQRYVAQSGCLACHQIGGTGNSGPGPDLTQIGDRLPRKAIARTLVNPTAPMPSFKNLPPKRFDAIVEFLVQLK